MSEDNFFEIVSQFFLTLLANQETLGEEFEKSLPASFWDFYEEEDENR